MVGPIQIIPADLLGRYRVVLQLKDAERQRVGPETCGSLLEAFDRRYRECPGAAQLEALTYSLLESPFRLRPEVHECPGTSGPDFKVTHESLGPAYVECKYLDPDAVTRQSGLSGHLDGSGSYSHITPRLQSVIGDSAPQLAVTPDAPGVCLIGTDHPDAAILMDTYGATTLLTSTTHISVPLTGEGTPAGDPRVVALLRDSAFLRPPRTPGEELDRRRLPVSAVLLVAFNFEGRTASIMGVLNPFAIRPLDHRVFPRVPFARFERPPRAGDRQLPEVEFVVSDPEPHDVHVFPPDIPEERLRGGP